MNPRTAYPGPRYEKFGVLYFQDFQYFFDEIISSSHIISHVLLYYYSSCQMSDCDDGVIISYGGLGEK